MQTGHHISADYAIVPLVYPDDADAWLDMMEDAFHEDPTNVYVRSTTRNANTFKLRRHMRLARLKNNYEGLTPDAAGTGSLYAKVVHLPTGALVAGSAWQTPGRANNQTKSEQTGDETQITVNTPPTKIPYPLLPPGSEIAAEDSALSTIGPAMDEALEKMAKTVPMLGSHETRNQRWWYLTSLGVSTAHQGHRLGQALVQWGVERAMQDAAERPELAIKGAWLTATEAGQKTYKNSGFTPVALAKVVHGDANGGPGVRVFHGEAANEATGKGQSFVAFVKEFDQQD